ncbi:MAG TPA: DNA repair protein RadA [Candidatus Eisenbacteria bacterium]|nr:DNA repair protein RadA [Candidatus Eisenbacteria bacterium]
MAKKNRAAFFCGTCGHEEPRWFGRCPSCQAWNTASEAPSAGTGAASGRRRRWTPAGGEPPAPRALASVEVAETPRDITGIPELDRVLGGGLVPGSLILVGGDPGIGKSTLVLQVARALSGRERKVLYVAGEESEEQVRMRAQRLGATPESLFILCETDLEAVIDAASAMRPDVLVADSIQTLSRSDLEGGPGSVTQVRECGLALLQFAKATRTVVFLIGHVTKEGAVAGPRVLEHMVDAVLYLEGERYHDARILRAAKNRFGSTQELGVFAMEEGGLREVANPSAAFLSEARESQAGTAVVASLEGTRPLLVEVQALVSSSFYGTPQRVTSGFDARRLAVLLAVLERRVGLKIGRHDVFVSVTGGITLEEPGTDLGVALAVASSFKNRPLKPRTLAIGEVSLSGGVRRVRRLDLRLREAARLGFVRAGVPAVQAEDGEGLSIEVLALETLREAFDRLLDAPAEPSRSGPPAEAPETARA